ncbi:hypothetical protein FPZ12_016075 [Amycolatopsis acidicola]|uniref:DUF3558 domain-containing protein n=1 Tax=Amycolatopsis acidicola TaxID=2596893 RepID=A0A5N0V3A3_9PSEU|nr:hypothetical protein [Amycolatopsis acidicola]KAA9160919.1 hypothetical protein FPZ12_016075 [Amycolatopsis acidicola]
MSERRENRDEAGSRVVDEVRAAGGCAAGTGAVSSTTELKPEGATAFCGEYKDAFNERNCVLLAARGNLMTAVSLDVSGTDAADVRRRADAAFEGVAAALARS